ncbi:MAG: S8 family peptidase [Acidimicrobiaceae bacterium]|nr:S8 family peptidase [Acidimicrobiia bacterium]MCY4493974.1 S8 family peptidase [Acidimicrobiaceae bacterium]
MPERDGSYPHLVVAGYVDDRVYARKGQGDFKVRPVEDRAAHGRRVSNELDRAVQTQWIEAEWKDLDLLPVTAVPVAEIRRPQLIDTISDLSLQEQAEYVEDFVERFSPADDDAVAVCLLDTGVRRSHVLLADSLRAEDMHTVFGDDMTGDSDGHGTKMAGLALFGPLGEVLAGTGSVKLAHRLESVRFHVPDSPAHIHAPPSYGVVTALATATPEVAAERRRAFCLAVTSEPDRPGEPSIWSASVDALAVGTGIGASPDGVDLLGTPDDNAKRLFVVSAGNIREGFAEDYLSLCDVSPVEDPAQAWNALVVGAHTELTQVPADPGFQGWSALADDGELSPHSRTSLLAVGAKAQWPIRPDICMEGGNFLTDGAGDFHTSHPSVSVLTTGRRDDASLASANATSAATAQAARLAARAMAMYPSYWPETIRGLLPHAAEWTPAMHARVSAAEKKENKARMLRRYGWGVPTTEAVERSAKNAVTMVVQDTFTPFTGPDHQMRTFRLHQLPWPGKVLEEIGEADVELRVTLSYFIEPSASRRGWRQRYAYPSHGLRFELQRPLELPSDFLQRINRRARDEEGGSRSNSDQDQWVLGTQQRHRGSLHQDIWLGHGTELAATGCNLAVHAVGGWWKNSKREDRVDLPVRYSLLVSLKTAATGVDLYEPIAVELGVPTEAVAIEN